MVWLLSALLFMMTLFLYCLGGQTAVWTRRYLLPVLQSLLTLAIGSCLGIPWYISLVPLLWIAVWVEKSGTWLEGLEASIPIGVGIACFHTNWWLLGLIPAICGAFIPNLPGTLIGKTKYSILWRDVLRSGVVAGAWITVLVLK